MEELTEEENKEIEYLTKVYGDKMLKDMVEDWKKNYLESNVERYIKKKLKEQYEYLVNLRKDETSQITGGSNAT